MTDDRHEHDEDPDVANKRTLVDGSVDNPVSDQPTLVDGPAASPVANNATIADGVFEAADELPMPEQVGPFRILKPLGAGAMGTVYHGMQDNPSRDVAIKVMNPGMVSRKALRRFEFEAQTLANMHHAAIAQIYDAGTFEDVAGVRPYFAMEFIEGAKELDAFIAVRSLSVEEKIRLFMAVCEGVEYGHRRGIIHRDLKPENILVGEDGQPKIIDFGVARSAEGDTTSGTLATEAGRLIGTLQYMSPEQVEMDPTQLDTRSDVYSLGVILYELLCDALPYEVKNLSLHEASREIVETAPKSPASLSKSLKGDLETITLKALEKDRDRRYGSAQSLADDLRRHLDNEPIEARPPTLSYRLSKFARKHRAATISTAAMIVLVITSAIVSAIGWREADLGWAEAEAQRQTVEAQNAVLDKSLTSLLTGVMSQVKHLGGSARAQRAILDVAGKNVDAMAETGDQSFLRLAQRGMVLMMIGRSYLSSSGVGSGNLEEAQAALDEAGEIFASIDLPDIKQDQLRIAISRMRLDRLKYLAELSLERAAQEADAGAAKTDQMDAIDQYRTRISEAMVYQHADDDDIKAIDVQMSSHQGLGNVLMDIGAFDEAHTAFSTALEHANYLFENDQGSSNRRMRDRAIAMMGIASVEAIGNPHDALETIGPAIDIARSLIVLEPNNVRRPRDLAIMLSLRASTRMQNSIDTDAALADYREMVELLTSRAVRSPAEEASKRDFENELSGMCSLLQGTQYASTAGALVDDAVGQMACVASAQHIAGDDSWTVILDKLNDTARQLTIATP